MNMNLNLDDGDDDDDDDDDGDGDGEVQQNLEKEEEEGDIGIGDGNGERRRERQQTEVFADEANNDVSAAGDATTSAATFISDNEVLDHEQDEDTPPSSLLMLMQPADVLSRLAFKRAQKNKAGMGAGPGAGAAATLGLTSDGNEATSATAADTGVRFVATARNAHRRTRANNQHKKHKSPKGLALSTLLCEGYNIEQRNCNSFECSGKCNQPQNMPNSQLQALSPTRPDDISDLLKFYKKLPTSLTEDATPIAPIISDSTPLANEFADLTTSANSMGMPTSSTPSNMGYVRNWRNMLNFTLMITLRAKVIIDRPSILLILK